MLIAGVAAPATGRPRGKSAVECRSTTAAQPARAPRRIVGRVPEPAPPPGRVLAIDPGQRWIGVALSDDARRLALPSTTIDRRALRPDTPAAIAAAIHAAIAPDAPALLVVGVPYRPDGAEDAQAAAFRELGAGVAGALGLPLAVQGERHSNDAAPAAPEKPRGGRRPGAVSPARRARRREKQHAAAAATILQRWLDAQRPDAP